MSEEEKDIELLDRYLKNELSSEQKAIVTQRLQTDSEFKQLLENMRVAIAAVKITAREKLRDQFNILETEISKKEQPALALVTRFWPIGIAALLVIGIGIVWRTKIAEPKEPPLFAEVFVPYPNVIKPTVRGVESDSSKLTSAYAAYDLGDYQKSISIFSSLPAKDAGVLLYLGNSYLAYGEPSKARQQLELLKTNFEVFDEQAEWFIALSYLKENNFDACITQLQAIVDQQKSYSTRAKDLLSRIKSIER